jgi:hypothetical protein
MKRVSALFLVLVSCSLLIAGCTGTTPATVLPTIKSTVPVNTPTSDQTEAWQADGVIGTGEYPHQATLGSITVYYRNDAQYLYLALQAQDCSFLAFAVAPKSTMADANFLIGTVSKGTVKVEDQFGASYHSHTLDTLLGGTNDIVASGGTQQNGITIWEAQIPLDSGDKYDIPLKPGQTVSVIVSSRSSDNLTSPHTFVTSGEIKLD